MNTKRQQQPSTVTVHVLLKFTIRGGRKTIIGEFPHQAPKTRFDDSIAKALARAYRWKQNLEAGTYATITELASAERINESYVTRILRLNLLAPDIVEAALDGKTVLTVQSLSKPISTIWHEQRTHLFRTACMLSSKRMKRLPHSRVHGIHRCSIRGATIPTGRTQRR